MTLKTTLGALLNRLTSRHRDTNYGLSDKRAILSDGLSVAINRLLQMFDISLVNPGLDSHDDTDSSLIL